jgi:hypothetical protein
MDFKTFVATCRAQAAAKRAKSGLSAELAAAVASAFDSKTTVAGLNFSGAPTWSDADIMTQFASIRDKRYMTTPNDPNPPAGFQRRISWMYPNDGCFARAEEFDKQASLAGKARPYKLFAFGGGEGLRVYTDNDPSGIVNWWYHVVAAVKNSAGELIVFDPAISPCRPLPWKEWLLTMQSDLAFYDDLANDHGVALADSNAYGPSDPVTGGAPLQNDNTSTLDEVDWYLPYEWSRQQFDMGRDASVVLGSTPPWSGYSCVAMDNVWSSSNVAPGASATVTTTCPYATLAVGGAFQLSDPGFAISKSAMSGNGWQTVAKNTGSATQTVWTSALCLVGAPAAGAPTGPAYVTSVQGSVINVNANSNASSTATCGSGKLVSGGYTTTLAGTPSTVMRIYSNGPSSTTTWRVSAQNTTSTQRAVTAFAYCLNNTNFSITQKTSSGADSNGLAATGCTASGETLVGGGWVFPRTTAYSVLLESLVKNSVYLIQFVPPPASGDANAKAYAQCLTHP